MRSAWPAEKQHTHCFDVRDSHQHEASKSAKGLNVADFWKLRFPELASCSEARDHALNASQTTPGSLVGMHATRYSSILNVPFRKITHNLTVYLQCKDCKNITVVARCLLHAKVHLPLWALQCFKGLDMGSAVEDNYRKYPIVTVPYSPHMHSNCASYCYWFTCKLVWVNLLTPYPQTSTE